MVRLSFERLRAVLTIDSSTIVPFLFFEIIHTLISSSHCRFGKGGWGRLNIGLYVLFLEKWLEHFTLDQFLILRLESYAESPEKYIMKILSFLKLSIPTGKARESFISKLLQGDIENEHMYVFQSFLSISICPLIFVCFIP